MWFQQNTIQPIKGWHLIFVSYQSVSFFLKIELTLFISLNLKGRVGVGFPRSLPNKWAHVIYLHMHILGSRSKPGSETHWGWNEIICFMGTKTRLSQGTCVTSATSGGQTEPCKHSSSGAMASTAATCTGYANTMVTAPTIGAKVTMGHGVTRANPQQRARWANTTWALSLGTTQNRRVNGTAFSSEPF